MSIQEVAAAFAVLTRHGISAAESGTAINNMMLHIANPTDKAKAAMKEFNIEYGFAALAAKGLGGWLEDASKKLGNNKQALHDILPEIRGFKALAVLSDGGGKEYLQMLNDFGVATQGVGATQRALERQTAGLKFTWAELTKEVKIAAIEFTDVVAPALKGLVDPIRDMVERLKGMNDTQKQVALGVGAFVASLGPLLLGFGAVASAITKTMTLVETLAPLFAEAGGAVGILAGAVDLLSGPIGWAIAAVAALAAAWYNNWGGIREYVTSTIGEITAFVQNNLPLIEAAVKNVFENIKNALGPLLDLWAFEWNAVVTVLSYTWNIIKGILSSALTGILGAIKVFLQIMAGDWRGAWETMRATMAAIWSSMIATAAHGAGVILSQIQALGQGIADAYHGIKVIMGLSDVTDSPGKVTALDGLISGLKAVEDGANSSASALQGVIGMNRPSSSKKIAPVNPFGGGGASIGKHIGIPGGGGGGDDDGGGSDKMSDAQKKLKEQADELRKTITDLTKEIALNGDTSKAASLSYDMATGAIKAQNWDLANNAIHLSVQAEAQAKAREAAKALKSVYDDLVKSTADQVKANQAALATNEYDRLSIEKFGKSFDELSDAKNRDAIVSAVWAKGQTDSIAAAKSLNEFVKSTLDGLKDEIALRDKKSKVEKLEYELSKDRYKNLTADQRAALIESAKAIDELDNRDAVTKALDEMQADFEKTTEAARKLAEEIKKAADEKFAGAMSKLNERVAMLGGSTSIYNYQLKQMAIEFGTGSTEAEKMASGMARATEYMKKLTETQQLEQFVALINKAAEGFSKTMTDSLGKLVTGGIRPFFGSLIEGFRSTLATMAQEWLQSQIRSILQNAAGSLLGGLLGASSGVNSHLYGSAIGPGLDGNPIGHAVGGEVLPGHLFRMNEQGKDEMFIAPNGGTVIPASLSRTLAKTGLGGGVTVVINVSTPDADSFRRSQSQISTEFAAALRRTTNRA